MIQKKFYAVIIITMLVAIIGCSSMQGKTGIDQAIQYRSGFNTLLSQWNVELSGMSVADQKIWATKSIPFVQAGVASLDMMDIVVGAGGTPTQENVQAYLAAKNKMIDLLAQLVLAKKGGK